MSKRSDKPQGAIMSDKDLLQAILPLAVITPTPSPEKKKGKPSEQSASNSDKILSMVATHGKGRGLLYIAFQECIRIYNQHKADSATPEIERKGKPSFMGIVVSDAERDDLETCWKIINYALTQKWGVAELVRSLETESRIFLQLLAYAVQTADIAGDKVNPYLKQLEERLHDLYQKHSLEDENYQNIRLVLSGGIETITFITESHSAAAAAAAAVTTKAVVSATSVQRKAFPFIIYTTAELFRESEAKIAREAATASRRVSSALSSLEPTSEAKEAVEKKERKQSASNEALFISRFSIEERQIIINNIKTFSYALETSWGLAQFTEYLRKDRDAVLSDITYMMKAVELVGRPASDYIENIIAKIHSNEATIGSENASDLHLILNGGLAYIKRQLLPEGKAGDMAAIFASSKRVINSAIRQGMLNERDEYGQGLLDYVVTTSNLELFSYLLAKPGLQINNSVIFTVINSDIAKQALPLLLAKVRETGGDITSFVNAVNESGMTPLHLAASEGLEEIADILIKSGASITTAQKDREGKETGFNAIHMAAKSGRIAMVNKLIAAGRSSGLDINYSNSKGVTAFHLAADADSSEVIDALLKAGANMKLRDNEGRMALHYAARGRNNAVLTLLERGAKLSWCDNKDSKTGNNAMRIAAVGRHNTTVKIMKDFYQLKIIELRDSGRKVDNAYLAILEEMLQFRELLYPYIDDFIRILTDAQKKEDKEEKKSESHDSSEPLEGEDTEQKDISSKLTKIIEQLKKISITHNGDSKEIDQQIALLKETAESKRLPYAERLVAVGDFGANLSLKISQSSALAMKSEDITSEDAKSLAGLRSSLTDQIAKADAINQLLQLKTPPRNLVTYVSIDFIVSRLRTSAHYTEDRDGIEKLTKHHYQILYRIAQFCKDNGYIAFIENDTTPKIATLLRELVESISKEELDKIAALERDDQKAATETYDQLIDKTVQANLRQIEKTVREVVILNPAFYDRLAIANENYELEEIIGLAVDDARESMDTKAKSDRLHPPSEDMSERVHYLMERAAKNLSDLKGEEMLLGEEMKKGERSRESERVSSGAVSPSSSFRSKLNISASFHSRSLSAGRLPSSPSSVKAGDKKLPSAVSSRIEVYREQELIDNHQKRIKEFKNRAGLFQDSVKIIINRNPGQIDALDSQGLTLLHHAIQNGMEDLSIFLINNNANLNIIAGATTAKKREMKDGKKHIEIVEGSSAGKSGKTAIHFALEQHSDLILQALVDKGANLDNSTSVSDRDNILIRYPLFGRERGRDNYSGAAILLAARGQPINRDYLEVLTKWHNNCPLDAIPPLKIYKIICKINNGFNFLENWSGLSPDLNQAERTKLNDIENQLRMKIFKKILAEYDLNRIANQVEKLLTPNQQSGEEEQKEVDPSQAGKVDKTKKSLINDLGNNIKHDILDSKNGLLPKLKEQYSTLSKKLAAARTSANMEELQKLGMTIQIIHDQIALVVSTTRAELGRIDNGDHARRRLSITPKARTAHSLEENLKIFQEACTELQQLKEQISFLNGDDAKMKKRQVTASPTASSPAIATSSPSSPFSIPPLPQLGRTTSRFSFSLGSPGGLTPRSESASAFSFSIAGSSHSSSSSSSSASDILGSPNYLPTAPLIIIGGSRPSASPAPVASTPVKQPKEAQKE